MEFTGIKKMIPRKIIEIETNDFKAYRKAGESRASIIKGCFRAMQFFMSANDGFKAGTLQSCMSNRGPERPVVNVYGIQ